MERRNGHCRHRRFDGRACLGRPSSCNESEGGAAVDGSAARIVLYRRRRAASAEHRSAAHDDDDDESLARASLSRTASARENYNITKDIARSSSSVRRVKPRAQHVRRRELARRPLFCAGDSLTFSSRFIFLPFPLPPSKFFFPVIR